MTKEGVPDVSQRDLGLLLEAVALTTNPKTQADLVEYGLLQAFQVCVHKLGGGRGPDYVPILRKMIKIIDNIMTNSRRLVKDGVVKARTARVPRAGSRGPEAIARRGPAGSRGWVLRQARPGRHRLRGRIRCHPGRVSPAFGARAAARTPLPRRTARGAGGGYYGASPAGSAAAGSGAPRRGPPG